VTASADVVIIGAGIGGCAAAYHLAIRRGIKRVVIIDEREPLTLTSDKGTQGYRNWWPGPDDTMLRFVSRSIDIMEELADESGNAFRMSRHGYLFVTGTDEGVERMRATAREVSSFGMGPLREHPGHDPYVRSPGEGFRDLPIGADLLSGDEVRRVYPCITTEAKAALHVRRAGWVYAVPMGAWLLKRALGAGASFVSDRVVGIRRGGGRVSGVRLASGATIETDRLVIAVGPELPGLLAMLDVELPVFHELHAKLTFRDRRGTIGRDAPFMIWTDPMELPWSIAERLELKGRADARHLLEPFPGGVHIRPVDGPHGDELYFIWTYHTERAVPVWPPRFDPHYGEIMLRGAARLVPAVEAYFGQGNGGLVDGGYYCKTIENRPLVGPLPVEGAFVLGALSGVGIMASQACAELLASHVAGDSVPDYARWFLPSRYDDAVYRAEVERWGSLVGQL
jgi:glycine/D-amino acid oxidase-like deaminating enzyme